MEKDITVIIPVYPHLKLLYRAMESLQRQMFKNFDVVVVVDNEGDFEEEENTIKNLFSSMDIKFINHGKNRSTLQARLTGIDHITGKYVFFMDHDDEISKEVLYNTFNQAEKENADMVGMKLSTQIDKKCIIEGKEILYYANFKIDRMLAPMVPYLYRSDLVRKVKGMLNVPKDLYIIYLEDMYLGSCIMSQASKVIENYENGTYFYNHDNDNSTLTYKKNNREKIEQQNAQGLQVKKLINNFLIRNGCDKKSIGYSVNNLGNYILKHNKKIIR